MIPKTSGQVLTIEPVGRPRPSCLVERRRFRNGRPHCNRNLPICPSSWSSRSAFLTASGGPKGSDRGSKVHRYAGHDGLNWNCAPQTGVGPKVSCAHRTIVASVAFRSFAQQPLREVVCSRIPVRHYCGLIFLPQVANAIGDDEPRSGVPNLGQATRHHSTHQRGADVRAGMVGNRSSAMSIGMLSPSSSSGSMRS